MDAQVFQSVDLARSDGELAEGLVSTAAPPTNLSPYEASVVLKAATFKEVAFVFFRRFSDQRSPQVSAFVIDNRDERLSKDTIARLHNDLWFHGVAPLVYVAWPTQIDILSCARGPDFWKSDGYDYSPADEIQIASQIESTLVQQRRFSIFRLADGTFWDDPQNHSLADHEKTAHEALIKAIVEADQALDGNANPILRRLLLLMVLIKYLEDREVFPEPQWFGRFHKGARCFFDVLASSEPDSVTRLLHTLERKFNGDVFSLPQGARLTKKALQEFAKLIEARTKGDQRYLWEQYSFAHLPVEVVSHLYQRFVYGSTAVYTPPFLASLLLDFAMPYSELTGKERVIDPACGSGVFLVGAFRRLVNVSRAKRNWARPSVPQLKQILREQIFGVEMDDGAIDLTAFSLALAVCDTLQPNVIWNKLKFDRLKDTNLLVGDFFDFAIKNHDKVEGAIGKFDLVIGNPPFEEEFSESAKVINDRFSEERESVPAKQVAYLFLDEAARSVNAMGKVCLIQPSGFLYNLQSHSFRSFIAESAGLTDVLDFTSIRGLYDGADPKTVAVILDRDVNRTAIAHLTFRRTYETTQRIGFELDHYDRHELCRKQLVNEPRAARPNLLGGGRLAGLASRLQQMRSLRQFVDQNNWLMGEGFIEGKKGTKNGDHLVGQPFLPTRAFESWGFDASRLETVTAEKFYREGREELFQPPLLLIKEHASLPIAFWEESRLTYKHMIVGVHAPPDERESLEALFDRFVRNVEVLRFAVTINGSQALVGKATALLKSDIESLPFPEEESDLEFAFWEQCLANDTLEYMAPFIRLGQESELLTQTAGESELNEYNTLFCRMLGSIYENLNAADPIFLGGLTCQPFFFGNVPEVEWLGPDCEEHLSKLVFDNSRANLRTNRVVRYYHKNVIFIVKPSRLRYWIQSTAIRDADDTLVDLQRQGY